MLNVPAVAELSKEELKVDTNPTEGQKPFSNYKEAENILLNIYLITIMKHIEKQGITLFLVSIQKNCIIKKED